MQTAMDVLGFAPDAPAPRAASLRFATSSRVGAPGFVALDEDARARERFADVVRSILSEMDASGGAPARRADGLLACEFAVALDGGESDDEDMQLAYLESQADTLRDIAQARRR